MNRRIFLPFVVGAAATCLLMLQAFLPTCTFAASFVVNSFQDTNDLEPGNGLCVAYLIVFPPYVFPFCTLRGAIEETNKLPGPDIIHIPAGFFTLSIAGTDEDTALTGDLDITDSLTIVGAGTNKTFIDADSLDRVFDIFGPSSDVTLSDLTIMNGTLSQGENYTEGGGGIRNNTTLTLKRVSVSTNSTGSGAMEAGGGILNLGECTISDSTIENNMAGSGGGIFNNTESILNLSTSTLHANRAETGGGLSNQGSARLVNTTLNGNIANLGNAPQGGAIQNSADLEILQSTIAGNSTSGQGGGISNSGITNMINTIIADNVNDNCATADGLFSLGHNLEGENSCGLDQDTDLIDLDPALEVLKNNFGPTKTMAINTWSPAVDKGKDLTAEGILTDQRGEKRPSGEAYDIGAYERLRISIVPILFPLILSDKTGPNMLRTQE